MFHRIGLLLVVSILFFTGCGYAGSEHVDEYYVVNYSMPFSFAPIMVDNIDQVLEITAMSKFREIQSAELAIPHIQRGFYSLQELFVPRAMRGMVIDEIGIISPHSINFIYNSHIGEEIVFTWKWGISPEDATRLWFERSGPAATEYIINHNGIYYGIVERLMSDGTWWGYIVSWTQYGQTFYVFTSPGVALDEALAFSVVERFTTWELYGNAISVCVCAGGLFIPS